MTMKRSQKIFSAITLLLCFLNVSAGTEPGIVGGGIKCETEDDVDFEKCKLEQLGSPILIGICDRIGLDVEEDVFEYLKMEDAAFDPGDEYTHADYVRAAYECLSVESEVEQYEERQREEMRKILKADPSLIDIIWEQAIENNPGLIEQIQEEMERDSEEWADFMAQLGEGETLADRHDVLVQVVTKMILDDPTIVTFEDEINEEMEQDL